MKMSKLKILAVSMMAMVLSGCVCDGKVSKVRESWYETGILEREGLALARVVTSPYSIVGFTYADCKKLGAASVLLLPFDLLLTVPAGCLAACADILTGTGELLAFHQFKDVSYPWESFDREKSKEWERPVIVMYCAALAGAAEGTASALAGGSGRASSSSTSYHASDTANDTASETGAKPKPRLKHSSCNGSGKCHICRGRGFLGSDPGNSRLRCRGCGGTGNCRACNGTGYAN